ncbi:MAG: cohesin domain-containing protein [Eubacteriales bacterium]
MSRKNPNILFKLSILCCFVILTMLLSLTASSPFMNGISAAAEQTELVAGSVSGAPGEVVQVPVNLTSLEDVAGIQFDLTFDHNLLTYQGKIYGSLTNGKDIDENNIFNITTNLQSDDELRVMIYSATNTLIAAGTGTVVELKFQVAAGVAPGQICSLELNDVTLSDAAGGPIAITATNGQFSVPRNNKEPGGDISNSVYYIAVKDSANGETKYYYYTKEELQGYETQESYTYDDHSVIKTVTCKGALLKDLLNNLQGVTITDDMVIQYAEEDAYHADPNTAVIDSNYKDTVASLTQQTVNGSGSTKNPVRSIVSHLIHEEYANPDAYNVNDPPGVFKDADNNSGFLRAYRDTGSANSAVIKYLMGVVVSTDGALLTGNNGCVATCVSDKNPAIKVANDSTIKGLLPGMQYAVKAPAVTNAALTAGQTNPVLITVGDGAPSTQVITFTYTEDTYFYVKNITTGATTNYTYTDLIAAHVQMPDAGANTAPYGYSRPMYYRYNGVWLSSLLSGVSGDYTVKLVAKGGTKTDITDNIALYFAAYNNTQSKSSANIPEGKRVTITYNDAKIIIPGAGENITGSGATDYTTAGKDVDVLVAAAEGLELTAKQTNNHYQYTVIPVADEATYQTGATTDGISMMTVKSGVSGMKYFAVQVTPVKTHNGTEAVAFVHLRNGAQDNMNVTKADFDVVNIAQAGFNVQPGDVVNVYIVDDLTNDVDFNPTILQ